ncbi:MAG: transcriptional regulator, family [Herbinix sp.]|jgi:transcriptional regulator with XRE-family HTH domain|nr:transcriptional regulator, family [Herbinix sp.]
MKFCDKLIQLRREKGYSQEQLADMLNISRQSVSKWEAGQSMPELSKLLILSDVFSVSVDYLLKEDQIDHNDKSDATATSTMNDVPSNIAPTVIYYPYQRNYEFKSKQTVMGVPLVHINMGHGFKVAKGIIAIGNISIGLLSIGGFSLGGISVSGIGLGLLAFGGIAIGGIAFGGVAIGILSIGAVAIGFYTLGAASLANQIAVGAAATGKTAIGVDASGDNILTLTEQITKTTVRDFIMEHHPKLWKPLLNFLTGMFRS